MMALAPVIIAFISYGFWGIKGRNEVSSHWKNKATSTFIILLFLVHPNLVEYFFGVFNCYDIDGTKKLKGDLEIVCYEGPHLFWAFFVALPCILVWGLGIPFFAYILLQREKERLKRIEVREKFGFLYNGYKKDFYYWEVVIMYRKILVVFIAVFLVNLGSIT